MTNSPLVSHNDISLTGFCLKANLLSIDLGKICQIPIDTMNIEQG